MKTTLRALLSLIGLSLPAAVLLAQTPQLPALPKVAAPVETLALPRNIGIISGIVELANTPAGGCTTATHLQLMFTLDGRVVPADHIEKWLVSTPDRFTQGVAYRIRSVNAGRHVLAAATRAGCAGFRWSPVQRSFEITVPRMQADGQDFRYTRS